MKKLIDSLIDQGYLKTPSIINAFREIDREDFVVPRLRDESYSNHPLPIGYGQTISQPLTVAFMLELLQPELGDKILDVGSGSGWQTAMLAQIVGPRGRVFAIERIAELMEFGKNNVSKYSFVKKGIVEFSKQDGSRGLPDHAPFDKIIVAAASRGIPNALKEQLIIGGRLVIPTKSQDIRLIIKKDKNKFEEKRFPGFVFVPLVEE